MKGTHKELTLMLFHALASVAAAAVNQALPGCRETCGDVSIPYPFGVGEHCSLETFNLNCTDSILYHGNVQVSNISLEGQLDLHFFVSQLCVEGQVNSLSLSTPSFTISRTGNKFITVGCDSYGLLNSYYKGTISYSTGCLTLCNGYADVQSMQYEGYCSGVGCCQMDIPFGMNNITLRANSFTNFNNCLSFNNSLVVNKCSYAFIAKKGFYQFSLGHLVDLPNKTMPMVAEWAVGVETCKEASQKRATYACKKNSFCEDTNTEHGYRCRCTRGYEGNPYHPDGCQDIDECVRSNHTCTSSQICHNTNGSYGCFPDGQSGNEINQGPGQPKKSNSSPNSIGAIIGGSVGSLSLTLVTYWVYKTYRKRKLIKLRKKFFRRNGGVIFLQQLSGKEDTSKIAQIFTAKELKKATNNYDASLVISKQHHGTVFKGVLTDNKVVAIKKSKGMDPSQVEQFINEVAVLSHINHRNTVRLLGCCLDTSVPSLVYEFVNSFTLFDYLHKDKKVAKLVYWKTRLRIAAEVAGALSYMHSDASKPIIHRDIKSANILFGDNDTAKVSDFGASRLVPLDQTEVDMMMPGTIGYLDPEYLHTREITEKSDVYSFGVVLVELLTGELAFSLKKPKEKRSLAMHFLSCLKEDLLIGVLDNDILNDENKDEMKEVAILAAKCLRLQGVERPNMKEVAMELEGIRLKNQACSKNEASSTFEPGDSSSHQNTGNDSLEELEQNASDDER